MTHLHMEYPGSFLLRWCCFVINKYRNCVIYSGKPFVTDPFKGILHKSIKKYAVESNACSDPGLWQNKWAWGINQMGSGQLVIPWKMTDAFCVGVCAALLLPRPPTTETSHENYCFKVWPRMDKVWVNMSWLGHPLENLVYQQSSRNRFWPAS